jgi:HIRAN domain
MFKFLRERREREVLTQCEAELERTQRAKAAFVNSPRDLATRALLERAKAEDLAEHPTIKRLDFLQRLLAGLATEIGDRAIPAFIAEARALGLIETDAVQLLIEHQRMQMLAEHGPEVIERTANALERWTEIQGLKQARHYADLERVLLEFVDSVERENQKGGIATTAYWELAVLYRKLKRRSDEIAILERFEKQAHGPGAMPRKLLERLMKLSGRTIPLPPKPVYDPRPRPRRHNFMAIVGESHRQDVLRAALETHGTAENAVVATLECEPQNEFDANAVAVKIGGQLVGYLSRDVAKRFRPFIAASPIMPVTCKSTLMGGTADKPSIGLVLDFSSVYLLRDDPAF